MKSICHLFILTAVVVACSGCKTMDDKQIIIQSSDYDFHSGKDATPEMLRMLTDAKNANNSRIVIEKGTYHFYPDKAFEKYCFITNHDDGLRSTPFPLINMKNLEIVADSAEFIFHGLMVPFIIEGSQNIRLSGFSIDWEIPLHSEVEVVNVDESNHTFDIRIDMNTPYVIRNGELIFLKEGYEHNLDRAICWDPVTMAPAYNTTAVTPLTMREPSVVRNLSAFEELYETDPLSREYRYRDTQNSLIARELDPGIVRIFGNSKGLPEIGHMIVAKGQNAYNRYAPAIRVYGSKNIFMEHITVHHAGGMGIICESTENITLHDFNVALKPGSGRYLTTTADATHFNNCRGLVEMKNCLFENMLDDGANIHGSYVRIADVIADRTIGVHIGHFQQMGMEFVRIGDRCGFVKEGKQFTPYFTSEVSDIQRLNKRYFILTFEDSIEGVNKGDLLESIDWYPKVHISGCTVQNNRARGFLFSTPLEIICENNYISTMMSAILFPSEFANVWYESGIVKNCIIRNNTFGDCGYGSAEGGVSPNAMIQGGHEKKASDEPYPLGTLIIENNVFQTFNSFLFNHGGIEEFVFRNNTLELTDNYPQANTGNPVIQLFGVKNKTIENNRIPEELLLVNPENENGYEN